MAACAPLPERLGAYRLLRRLPSRDGTDEYAALEEGPLGFRREVLLKLAPYRGGPSQAARDLAREAAAVASLNHPGLVRMYEFFEYEGRLVLVLERGEGTHLGRLLAHCRRQRRPLDDEAVFHVAHRVASALAHAHGREAPGGEPAPVAHRALGPTAVLLGWDASVRLAGFGFAKILSAAAETTQLGITRGVPGYMAPEQLRGEPVSERADVYQLGLLVWEMLANRPPGWLPWAIGPNGTEAGAGARPDAVGSLRPTVPPEIVAALEAALEPDPQARTLRAADLARWLARTVDVEAGRDILRRRLGALRGPRLRHEREARGHRAGVPRGRGARRWTAGEPLSLLAAGDALALSSFAPASANEPAGTAPPDPPRRAPDAPLTLPNEGTAAAPPDRIDVSATLPLARSAAGPVGTPSGWVPPDRTSGPGGPGPTPGGGGWRPTSSSGPPVGVGAQGLSGGAMPWAPGPFDGVRPSNLTPEGFSGLAPPKVVGGPGQGSSAPGWAGGATAAGGAAWSDESGRGGQVGAAGAGGGPRALLRAAIGGALLLLVGVSAWSLRDRGARTSGEGATAPAASGPSASASASASASVEREAEEAPLPPPRGYGSLVVHSPLSGYVYINGVPYGPSERPVLAPCGRRHVRIGAPPEPRKRTVWLTAGVWTAVPCGESTELAMPGAKP